MKKLLGLSLLIGALAIAPAATASSGGRTLCVGKHHCYSSIQAAVDAAHDGDTVAVAPGRYEGGILIDKSIKLAGAGARSTIIKGGGPVLRIGAFEAPDPPTVTISGVTITGGLTTSDPTSPRYGKDGVSRSAGGSRSASRRTALRAPR